MPRTQNYGQAPRLPSKREAAPEIPKEKTTLDNIENLPKLQTNSTSQSPSAPPQPSRPRPPFMTPEQLAKQAEQRLQVALGKLDALIGLKPVKAQIQSLVNLSRVRIRRRAKGLPVSPITLHFVFTGNPGTGKTTVARLIGEIYTALGLLQKGHLVEVDRGGLVGSWAGQTATKTMKCIDNAMDGILFIDEAHTLVLGGGATLELGHEAIATLLKAMDDRRDRLAVIVAGHPERMRSFIQADPGLRSRFTRYVEFPDYTPSDLLEIFFKLCEEEQFNLTLDAQTQSARVIERLYSDGDGAFGNGRDIRTLFERTTERQAARLARDEAADLTILLPEDIPGPDDLPIVGPRIR